jgi:hypothetical protein
MLTFDLEPLARRLDCLPALEAAHGKDLSRVGWMFLGAMLREVPVESERTRAVVDPVIAGMDRLAAGDDWPGAAAAADAAWAAAAAESAEAAAWAAEAAAWAADAADAAAAYQAAARAATWAGRAAAAAAAGGAGAAEKAGLPYARQREILVRLIEEAT